MPLMLLIANVYVIKQVRLHGVRQSAPLLFMMYVIWYVTVIGVTLEFHENNRFHAMIDPILIVVTVLAVRSWLLSSALYKRFNNY
jgi:hypothetical protein